MNPLATLAIILTPILTAATLGYSLACWVKPFRACTRCDGMGRIRGKLTRRPRPCRRCRGTGLRLRIGRRIHNRLTHLHTEGTR